MVQWLDPLMYTFATLHPQDDQAGQGSSDPDSFLVVEMILVHHYPTVGIPPLHSPSSIPGSAVSEQGQDQPPQSAFLFLAVWFLDEQGT